MVGWEFGRLALTRSLALAVCERGTATLGSHRHTAAAAPLHHFIVGLYREPREPGVPRARAVTPLAGGLKGGGAGRWPGRSQARNSIYV